MRWLGGDVTGISFARAKLSTSTNVRKKLSILSKARADLCWPNDKPRGALQRVPLFHVRVTPNGDVEGDLFYGVE